KKRPPPSRPLRVPRTRGRSRAGSRACVTIRGFGAATCPGLVTYHWLSRRRIGHRTLWGRSREQYPVTTRPRRPRNPWHVSAEKYLGRSGPKLAESLRLVGKLPEEDHRDTPVAARPCRPGP